MSDYVPRMLRLDTLEEVEEKLKHAQSERLNMLHTNIGSRRRLIKTDESTVIFSLLEQLPTILEFEPDTILFTAYSAVPMSSVFTGIYDEYPEANRPDMAIVHTQKEKGNRAHEVKELRRLRRKLSKRRVAIVDQYVFSGASILSGLRIASQGGASRVLPIPGRWYSQYDDDARNPHSLSVSNPDLRTELRQIGHRLARAHAGTLAVSTASEERL